MSDNEEGLQALKLERREEKGERIHIDGEDLRGRTFENCTIIFSGGGAPKLGKTVFNACSWEFLGAAANTMSLLNTLCKDSSELRRFVIDSLLSGQMVRDEQDESD